MPFGLPPASTSAAASHFAVAFNVTFGSGTATSANASGVTVVNDSGPIGDVTKQFTMAFDTTAASPNFTLTEIGSAGTTLNGTITAILSDSQISNGPGLPAQPCNTT